MATVCKTSFHTGRVPRIPPGSLTAYNSLGKIITGVSVLASPVVAAVNLWVRTPLQPQSNILPIRYYNSKQKSKSSYELKSFVAEGHHSMRNCVQGSERRESWEAGWAVGSLVTSTCRGYVRWRHKKQRTRSIRRYFTMLTKYPL